MTAFDRVHPFVSLFYFAFVLTVSMLTHHPVLLGVSLVSSLLVSCLLTRGKSLRTQILLLPACLLMACLNPLFSHEGATILCYLPDGNPLTRESILYGLAAAAMFAAALSWCAAMSAVMSSDRLVFLFGRVSPGFALLFSMTLRFVPRFRARLRQIVAARRSLHEPQGRLYDRVRSGVLVFSSLVTWALESGVDTADSMKSRGYGLPGRSSYALYRMTPGDGLLLGWMALQGGITVWGLVRGSLDARYFPTLRCSLSAGSWGSAVSFLLFSCTPILLSLMEALRWHHLKSET